MSAADGGGGHAARSLRDEGAETPLDLIAAKAKVTGRDRVHLRVVEPEEDLDAPEEESERGPDGRRTRRGVRAKTISIKRMSKRELERGRMMYPETEHERPITRGDCQHGPHAERPCPFVSCKHHLYLEVDADTGSIKLNFPDRDPDELAQTCALRVAESGGATLEGAGELLNLTRERIRQIETRALRTARIIAESDDLGAYVEDRAAHPHDLAGEP